MVIVYITCSSVTEAKKIGRSLLKKRLCVCINIYPTVQAIYWWPPKADKLEEETETVLLVKTLEGKFEAIESEVRKLQTYDTVTVFSYPVTKVSQNYYNWLVGEVSRK